MQSFAERRIGTLTIALGGFGRRTGSSFQAIQLSAFLKSQGMKVACVELAAPHHSYKYFVQSEQKAMNSAGGYAIKGIMYYPNWDTNRLHEVYGAGYQVIVLDCGNIVEINSKGDFVQNESTFEFFKADRSIVTTFTTLWDQANFLQLLMALRHWGFKKKLHLLASVSSVDSNHDLKEYVKEQKKLNVQYFSTAFVEDPFKLSESSEEAFSECFMDIIPKANKEKKLFSLWDRRIK
ncbi:hypothetical protein D3C74_90960 [compost metagenome]